MTEIPEHLLKRSRERRSSLGLPTEGDTGSGGGEPPAGGPPATSPAASSPEPAPVAAAAPAPAPPPKPVPAYVQASLRRQRIPVWAMPVVALLPIWLLVYVNAMRPSTAQAVGPLGEGGEVYSSKCVSCHGGSGEGGVGYQLSQGEVQKSFLKIEDQIPFVYKGTAGFLGQPYGSGRHVGGVRGTMPSWGEAAGGELTDVEILAVVCHERYDLSAGDQTSKEFIDWCTEEGAKWVAVGTGGLAAAGITGLTGT